MEPPNNLVLVIAAEVLFLALVAVVVWLLIARRELRAQHALLTQRNNEIATLRQRLELTHEHLQKAKAQIGLLEEAQQKRDDQLLLNYQQRISNLEKFKELYFELEDRLDAASMDKSGDKKDVEYYKQRAQQLEVTETRLQHELVGHRRRIEELEARRPTTPNYGVVRIKEVEDLSHRLQQRESEIRRLRQECETIGLQYEELATKSLFIAGEGGNLTEAQKTQLEELKRTLEENAAALARKQAECELLENYYLELEESAELAKTTEQMRMTYAERDALQQQQRHLNTQVESAVGQEAAEEMVKLRQILADKETVLDEIRDEYSQIKEQFVEVAQEQSELRKGNQELQQECDKLRREVGELSATRQELLEQQAELEKLRAEYSKMESRYLALVNKYQR